MRCKADLAERQARTGIIANPAKVTLPVAIPREVLTRWPDLRSKRRLRKRGQLDAAPLKQTEQDVTLDELRVALRRQDPERSSWLPQLAALLGSRQ